MDYQEIIELVMKKASKDKEFKKKLIENSEQAILDETGMTIAHKLKFFETDNGNLYYEIIEEGISDNDLEDLAGGKNFPPYHSYHKHKLPLDKKHEHQAPTQPQQGIELNIDQLGLIVGGRGNGQPSKEDFKKLIDTFEKN